MSYRTVAILTGVASAGLFPTILWPGTLAEMTMTFVNLGFLSNVALSNNSLTNDPSRNRRFRVEEGTDYHGQRLHWNPIGAIQVLAGLLTTTMYSKARIGPPPAVGTLCFLGASSRHIQYTLTNLVLPYTSHLGG